jgi:spore coat protein JB
VNKEQVELLQKLRALEFAAIDLNLFLDTHPECQEALRDYNCIVRELGDVRAAYEAKYGPTLNFGLSQSKMGWRWIDGPWPWQAGY